MYFDLNYIKIAAHVLKQIVGKTFPNPPVVSILVESDTNYRVNKIVSFGITSVSGGPMQSIMRLIILILKRIKNIHFTQHLNHVVMREEDRLVFQKLLIQSL